MEGTSAANQLPPEATVRRFKTLWRAVLIFNFGLGAYMFSQSGKKPRGKKKSVEPVEVASVPAAVTPPIELEPVISPPIEVRPVIVRQPIPEEQQREIFQWMLEEKRKVTPKSREEKKRINEEKAILKEFIRSKSIPTI